MGRKTKKARGFFLVLFALMLDGNANVCSNEHRGVNDVCLRAKKDKVRCFFVHAVIRKTK